MLDSRPLAGGLAAGAAGGGGSVTVTLRPGRNLPEVQIGQQKVDKISSAHRLQRFLLGVKPL
jgi:hypothetical protein